MANTSIFAAFERMWQHVMAVVGNKADLKHSHVAEDVTDLQTIVDEALSESVLYTEQSLADDQKAQARENIGAISSWADIPDKPFGEISTGSDTLYWDGNREGLVRADDYEQYLISESTPTLDDFANGASNTYLQSGTETSTNLGMNTAIYEAGDGVIVVGNSIVAMKDGATLGDTIYPKKGTYFTWIGNDSYTTSLTITGYNGFPSEKQIDEKWLPNHTHSTGPTPITTEGDGSAYTATIDGVTELYTGLQFVMIPHTNSTTTSVTLNVNGLGAKMIRQRLSTNTSISVVGATDNWIVSGKPVTVTYNGSFWIAELTRPDAANLYGTTGVKSGGTGKQSVTAGSFLVGNGTDAMIENTPAEVLTHIGAAPTSHTHDDRYYTESEIDTKLSAIAVGGGVACPSGHSTYTLSASDVGKSLHFMDGDSVESTTVVVPTDAALTIPIGSEIEIVRWNSGLNITIQTETGTTSPISFRTSRTNTVASLGINGKYGAIKLKRLTDVKWYASGDIADDHYPIGSIYLSVESTSPASLFGGTWTQLKDRFLLGAGSSYTNGVTGGSKSTTLKEANLPAHTHGLLSTTVSVGSSGGVKDITVLSTSGSSSESYIESTGSATSFTNLPPYLVVYMWKRTE